MRNVPPYILSFLAGFGFTFLALFFMNSTIDEMIETKVKAEFEKHAGASIENFSFEPPTGLNTPEPIGERPTGLNSNRN